MSATDKPALTPLEREMLEALRLAFAAMNYLGDVLNNMDAVLPKDVEATAAAFAAVRAAIAKAAEDR